MKNIFKNLLKGCKDFTCMLMTLISIKFVFFILIALCPVTVLVDSQVSDRCPWATCFLLHKSRVT